MKYLKLIAATLSLLVVLLSISCKKGSVLNLGTIRIATVTYSESGGLPGAGRRLYYSISYDQYNNVDSIGIIGGGVDTGYVDYKTFNYVGSSFVINDQLNGATSVDANTDGQILEVLLYDTLFMTYNGSELTELQYKQPSSTTPFYILDSMVYSWNNGDIMSYKYDTGVADTYYYDYSRNGQAGDALRIDNFLQYGRSYTTTNHLPDELYYGGTWVEEYLYQFDSQRRISVLTKVTKGAGSPNDTETYAYTYY